MGGLEPDLTPAMKQYRHFKQKYPDCLIMFRMGDFYEMFYEDAINASKILGITLTSRGKGEKKAPLAGIPFRAADTYIQRLIRGGIRLAIAEQMEDPKTVKGRIVSRDVVRIITPGTLTEEGMLQQGSNNFIAAVYPKGDLFGIAAADITTGDFFCFEAEGFDRAASELRKLKSAEVLVPESFAVNKEFMGFLEKEKVFVTKYRDSGFAADDATQMLKGQLRASSLRGTGLEDKPLLIHASGGLLSYLQETQKLGLTHINHIRIINLGSYMILDSTSLRNLEVFENIIDRSGKDTLISKIDFTSTSMGARLLKQWLQRPLIDVTKINKRQEAVALLAKNPILREEIRGFLKGICDIERMVGKLSYNSITPKDVVAISSSLQELPPLLNLLKSANSKIFDKLAAIPTLAEVAESIKRAMKENPPLKSTEGDIIKKGFNPELDELREIKESSSEVLKRIESEEITKTGIKTLRIGFNQVVGYYIQVSKSNADKVPQNYIQKQTLVGGVRYATEELKVLESKILGAEERINILEYELFRQVVRGIEENSSSLQKIARRLAVLDVFCSLAHAAEKHSYSRPIVDNGGALQIKAGRHPVVELIETSFIPNDTNLLKSEMVILTGPNMAGKSTFMRQICLIVLMAQVGSFVPAKEARIGVVDRIFTRVGAYDDLMHGQSTFMVEMDETANILNNATENSLIILDEVGRGTSTFDGVAIAWAVAEYLYNKVRAKTIFATHYHVLNKLVEEFSNIKNWNISVKEKGGDIIFLRKIEEGGTDKSYGIHVAKLAGMPKEVVDRAMEIQGQLMEEDEMLGKLQGKKHAEQFSLKKWEL